MGIKQIIKQYTCKHSNIDVLLYNNSKSKWMVSCINCKKKIWLKSSEIAAKNGN